MTITLQIARQRRDKARALAFPAGASHGRLAGLASLAGGLSVGWGVRPGRPAGQGPAAGMPERPARYGPRNSRPNGDTYDRWLGAHPQDREAYNAAVALVRRLSAGTQYSAADPEYL